MQVHIAISDGSVVYETMNEEYSAGKQNWIGKKECLKLIQVSPRKNILTILH